MMKIKGFVEDNCVHYVDIMEEEKKMCYNWRTLLYSRNYHNIVNQLYFSKTLTNEEKKTDNNVLKRQIGRETINQNYLQQIPIMYGTGAVFTM